METVNYGTYSLKVPVSIGKSRHTLVLASNYDDAYVSSDQLVTFVARRYGSSLSRSMRLHMYILDKIRPLIVAGHVGVLSALTIADSGKRVGLSLQSVQSVLRKLVSDCYIKKLVGAKSMANGEYLYVTAKTIPAIESRIEKLTVEQKPQVLGLVSTNALEAVEKQEPPLPIVSGEEIKPLSNVQILYNCQDMWFELINLAKNLEIKELHPTAVLAIEGAMSTYSENIVDALCNLNLKSKEV